MGEESVRESVFLSIFKDGWSGKGNKRLKKMWWYHNYSE